MCVVSMIGEHFRETLPKQHPQIFPQAPDGVPVWMPLASGVVAPVSREEFLVLKKTVDEMVVLLRRAKLYDEEHNEPDCEIEEKMDLLRKVARLVGVDLDQQLAKRAVAP